MKWDGLNYSIIKKCLRLKNGFTIPETYSDADSDSDSDADSDAEFKKVYPSKMT